MPKLIFVNLPVNDVAKSTAFYEAIGFEKNETFSNEQASAMVWSDTINIMLLSHDFYSTFTSKRIADAHQTSAALICLSRDSRADVDTMHAAALAAGGRKIHAPEPNGPMYGGAFEDPDGHMFEVMYMDMAAFAACQSETVEG